MEEKLKLAMISPKDAEVKFLVITSPPLANGKLFRYASFGEGFYENFYHSLDGDVMENLTYEKYFEASKWLKEKNVIFNKKKGLIIK